MLQARVSIPIASARILDATPYQLLPAPPSGYAYDVFDVVVVTNNASVPLTAGGSQYVGFTAAPATYPVGAVLLSNLTGGLAWITNMSGSASSPENYAWSHVAGQPLYLGGGSVDLAGGDAPVVVTVFYTLVAIP